MNEFLNSPIQFLKGVGENRARLLQTELGINSFEDLLNYFPFRYVDRSKFNRIKDIDSQSQYVQIIGKIMSVDESGYGKSSRLSAKFFDGENVVELVWFKGVKWVKQSLKINQELVLYGKPSFYKGKLNFAHPELDELKAFKSKALLKAVYSTSESMRKRRFETKQIRTIIENLNAHEKRAIPEIFSTSIIEKFKLLDRSRAFKFIHQPNTWEEVQAAQRRFKFEELFFLQFPFIRQKVLRKHENKGFAFDKSMPLLKEFVQNKLPFELTKAQERVLVEIREDLISGKQMNRLLQGDVGSGKTIMAFLSVLMAVDNKQQAALMAPTEILATQHYIGLKDLGTQIGIRCALLTGSTSAAERKEILRLIKLGEIHLIIGTHALIEDRVQIHDLGLVVIDEQHRFGVAQRARLQSKSSENPHVLVMTATPIPRTLAMSVYGDLDYSVIDELPKGRKTIKTVHRFGFARSKVYDFIRNSIESGRQAYVVYPLIEESEALNYKDLNSGYDEILKVFPRPKYQVDMLHGKMKADDKEAAMKRFKDGITNIIVSTTVIEVGIDVPNATIMVIESAEKFGLSQLHQLRGRVGRGAEQSYCILLSSKNLSENAQTRLKAMVQHSSGFELSEIDMQLRGFGDIAGTRQSGLDQLKLASLSEDQELAKLSREALIELLKEDPKLSKPENRGLNAYIQHRSDFKEWSSIA